MNKTELIDQIAKGTGLTKIETEAVVDAVLTLVRQELVSGGQVDLRGFGSFQVKARAARVARNPRTNEAVPVPAHYAPFFKPSRDLRDVVAEALGTPE